MSGSVKAETQQSNSLAFPIHDFSKYACGLPDDIS
jgi:hypothetical protein